jgi:tRNA/rRNA methyltransferase
MSIKPVIILVRPQLGENIGKTARAMANFGLSDLRLVAPRDGWPNPTCGAAAAGADDILNTVQVFERLEDAVFDLNHVYASTVRPRDMNKHVTNPETMASEMHEFASKNQTYGILFGPERSGLSNADTLVADGIVTVPINPEFSSLNLAQAVVICAYEWSKKSGQVVAGSYEEADPKASKKELISFFEHLEGELDKKGYFRTEARKPSMVETMRNMFQTAGFTSQQVQTLRGIVKSLSWKNKQ